MIKVIFAPDWRNGVSYQEHLANALRTFDIEVEFLSEYRRIAPLTRALRHRPFDILHLHWPEPYIRSSGGRLQRFRCYRLSYDLRGAARGRPIVYTAHNLYPHRWREVDHVRRAIHRMVPLSQFIVAHSNFAAMELCQRFGVRKNRLKTIAIGDLAFALPSPLVRDMARRHVCLDDSPVCLMFGVISPYKGIEEVIDFWRNRGPDARLAIVGKSDNEEYSNVIRSRIGDATNIDFRPQRVSDEELSWWLSAADCAIFNYRTILTSGSAPLARSWGIPLLIPERLKSVELMEPSPRVFRFSDMGDDFAQKLANALSVAPDWDSAADWRRETSWENVARKHAEMYRECLAGN